MCSVCSATCFLSQVAGAAGREALLQAARDGRVEALEALLAAGVEPSLPDESGRTALQLAGHAGHVECVHALLPPLANRTDLLLRALYTSDSAALLGALEAVVPHVLRGRAAGDMLKQAVRDGQCDVALLLMAHEKELDAAVLLTHRGANATCVAPLLNAVQNTSDKTEIVKRILKKVTALIFSRLLDRQFPTSSAQWLGMRCWKGDAAEPRFSSRPVWARTETRHGAPWRRLCIERIWIACRSFGRGAWPPWMVSDGRRNCWKRWERVKSKSLAVLLAAGVQGDSANIMTGRTPLMLAAEAGHTEVVRDLLENHSRVNRSDYQGYSFDTLFEKWSSRVVRLLLNSGAEINKRNKNGITALIYASWYGHSSVVRELLKQTLM